MWLQAFEIYFELKQIAECIKKNIPIPERIQKKRKDYVKPKSDQPPKSMLAKREEDEKATRSVPTVEPIAKQVSSAVSDNT